MGHQLRSVLILCMSLTVYIAHVRGEDAPAPKNPEVRTAIVKRDKAVEAARLAFAHAWIAADEQLIADLDKQMKAAMKNQNLAALKEAERASEQAKADLEKARESLKAGATPAVAKGGAAAGKVVVSVTATRPWQAFGNYKKGDNLAFTAEGQWSHGTGLHGPEGKGPGYLEGRVGEKGVPFVIGTAAKYSVLQDGVLYMQCHDSDYGNNAGEVTVSIERK